MSRSASESASASLHPNRPRPTFHEWRSLIPARKQRESTGGVVRGGWERRASKDKLRNLGDPCGWVRPNSFAECIRRRGPARKSDAFIVAGKRVTTVERRDATVGQRSLRQGVPLDRRVHYGRRGLCSRRGNAAEQLFAEMDAGPDRDAGTCEPRRASSRPTGEPDAGNPHVRFDEGGGIPAPTLPAVPEAHRPETGASTTQDEYEAAYALCRSNIPLPLAGTFWNTPRTETCSAQSPANP